MAAGKVLTSPVSSLTPHIESTSWGIREKALRKDSIIKTCSSQNWPILRSTATTHHPNSKSKLRGKDVISLGLWFGEVVWRVHLIAQHCFNVLKYVHYQIELDQIQFYDIALNSKPHQLTLRFGTFRKIPHFSQKIDKYVAHKHNFFGGFSIAMFEKNFSLLLPGSQSDVIVQCCYEESLPSATSRSFHLLVELDHSQHAAPFGIAMSFLECDEISYFEKANVRMLKNRCFEKPCICE